MHTIASPRYRRRGGGRRPIALWTPPTCRHWTTKHDRKESDKQPYLHTQSVIKLKEFWLLLKYHIMLCARRPSHGPCCPSVCTAKVYIAILIWFPLANGSDEWVKCRTFALTPSVWCDKGTSAVFAHSACFESICVATCRMYLDLLEYKNNIFFLKERKIHEFQTPKPLSSFFNVSRNSAYSSESAMENWCDFINLDFSRF